MRTSGSRPDVTVARPHLLSRCECLTCAEERQRRDMSPVVSDLERIARKMAIRDLVRGA